jgi:hypothetical protein
LMENPVRGVEPVTVSARPGPSLFSPERLHEIPDRRKEINK